jgi:hypothetical protein
LEHAPHDVLRGFAQPLPSPLLLGTEREALDLGKFVELLDPKDFVAVTGVPTGCLRAAGGWRTKNYFFLAKVFSYEIGDVGLARVSF